MMVGMNISDEQLGGIADRAISDADVDQDGVISFEELKRVSTSERFVRKLIITTIYHDYQPLMIDDDQLTLMVVTARVRYILSGSFMTPK